MVTTKDSLGYITFPARQNFFKGLIHIRLYYLNFQESGAQIELRGKKAKCCLMEIASVQ